MSDITVPSWRTRPEKSGPPWLLLGIAGGVLALAAAGGAVLWGVSRMGPQIVPVIEADSRPIKVRPDNAGGLIVPNQDQMVLEPLAVRRAAERNQGANSRLDTGPEAPALDILRQQAAPPAPQVVAPSATPAATQLSALSAPTLPAPVAAKPPVPGAAPPPAAATPTAAPTAGPPTRPAITPVANGRAGVQLGALATEEAAKTEWTRLARRVPELAGFRPIITRVERDGQEPIFRLRAGGLADAATAKSLCETVRAKGGACVASGG